MTARLERYTREDSDVPIHGRPVAVDGQFGHGSISQNGTDRFRIADVDGDGLEAKNAMRF